MKIPTRKGLSKLYENFIALENQHWLTNGSIIYPKVEIVVEHPPGLQGPVP